MNKDYTIITLVLGLLIFNNTMRAATEIAYPPEAQVWNVKDSSFSATVGESVMRKQPFDPVREARSGETRILEAGVAPGRNVGNSGTLLPHFSENYQFELVFGGHSTGLLWIGDTRVIDATDERKPLTGFIALEAGKTYPVKVVVSHKQACDARIELRWRSASQYDQPVPQSQLFPPQ